MIETARLLLRPPSDDDLEWFVEHMNTPAVTRHLGGARTYADFVAGFARNAQAFAEAGAGFFTVVLRDGGQRVGKCGLAPIEPLHPPAALRGEVQIGWSLAEQFWGQGFAAEAARAVLGHAFAERGHEAIFAQTSDSNRASTRLMERLGFVPMPALDYIDPDYPAADNPTTVYRLARDEWGAGQ